MYKHPYQLEVDELWRDMAVTRYYYTKFRSKEAREAINKLRYLLILTIHKVEPGDHDARYY